MKIEYRHSASKTNTFIDSPPFWIINELFGFESEPNARMVMGLAAEDAAHYALSNQITDAKDIANHAESKYRDDRGDASDARAMHHYCSATCTCSKESNEEPSETEQIR